MNPLRVILSGLAFPTLAVAVLLLVQGCASRSGPWRTVGASPGRPATHQQCDAYYIEGHTSNHGRPYSCSFIEFDEHGDYLAFEQHEHAWQTIEALGNHKTSPPLLVVIYCHGWKHDADSEDVLRFNRFLSRLADSVPVNTNVARTPLYRVHGVYLAWRGNAFTPYVNAEDSDFKDTMREFGEPIVDKAHSRSIEWPLVIPETLSYWNRKKKAEYMVSGVPLARSVFTCAYATKEYGAKDSLVLLIGHSFGALMLEKSIGQACLGTLISGWPWENSDSHTKVSPNPLPFDCVLFVNSAAPSLHSKELSDFLWAHQNRLVEIEKKTGQKTAWRAPIIISITSESDWATGHAHRIANILAPLDQTLQQYYKQGIFDGQKGPGMEPQVHQSYFYERTPGNNPLLAEYWIAPADSADNSPPPDNSVSGIVYQNWQMDPANPCQFFIDGKLAKKPIDGKPVKGMPVAWIIRQPNSEEEKWRKYQGWVAAPKGDYWIVRAKKEILNGHGEVWTDKAMELYVALFRLTQWLRTTADERAPAPKAPSWLFESKPRHPVNGTTSP